MREPLRGPPDQLLLPVVPRVGASLPGALADALWARIGSPPPGDAFVHLRCPGCAWVRTLRLPRSRRAPPRLERMLPRVPVRHWVFSLGEALQPRLTASARLRTRVARACVAAVFAGLRRAAARASIDAPASCGAVSTVHRVGAALDSNVHVHALVLDGAYTRAPDGTPVFHPLPAPRRRDLHRTLRELGATIEGLVARTAPVPVPSRSRTRVVHRVATGPPVVPITAAPGAALVQRCGELDVRAGPPVAADDRALRARLCRYVTRAPFDPGALSPGEEGRLRYRLRHPFADGTTHVELSPGELASRLETLAGGGLRPPVAFHGMLAPGAAVAWLGRPRACQLPLLELEGPTAPPRARAPAGLRCPRCHATMEIIGVEAAGSRAA